MKESKYGVVEIFSPPRVCPAATARGMKGGWSLGWMFQDPTTGQKWDLRKKHVQHKVLCMLNKDKPGLVVASPPCTLFSTLQAMNPKPAEEAWQDALEMVEFSVKICRMQAKAGRYFLFEHPLNATSWKVTSLSKLKKEHGVFEAIGDMCAFGMKAADGWGEGYARKPTRFLTNSKAIFEKLSSRCPGEHRHVSLVGDAQRLQQNIQISL